MFQSKISYKYIDDYVRVGEIIGVWVYMFRKVSKGMYFHSKSCYLCLLKFLDILKTVLYNSWNLRSMGHRYIKVKDPSLVHFITVFELRITKELLYFWSFFGFESGRIRVVWVFYLITCRWFLLIKILSYILSWVSFHSLYTPFSPLW